MIGIYAAGLFVLLLYDATGCGNALHRLFTELGQAKAIREDNARVARQLARDGEAFGVRRRRRQEALDSRERFLDELKRSLDAREDVGADGEDRLVALEAREAHFDTVFHRLQALRVMRPRRSLSKDVVDVTVQVDMEVWAGLCGPRNADPMGYEGYVANLLARECERVIKESHWGRLEPLPNFTSVGSLPAEERFEHWTSPLTSVAPAFASKELAGYQWFEAVEGRAVSWGFRQALADERMGLAPGDFRRYVIPHSDLIMKPPVMSEDPALAREQLASYLAHTLWGAP